MNEKQLHALDLIKERDIFWDIDLTTEDLIFKDETGKCLLEYAIESNVFLTIKKDIYYNSIEIMEIFENYGKDWKIKSLMFDEDKLFSNYKDKLLIEHLLEKDELSQENIHNIVNHKEIIDILIKQKKYYLEDLSNEIINYLISKNETGVYNIEKYIDNDAILEHIIKKIDDPNVIIELYNKYKKIEILENINEKVSCFVPNNNETLFEFLLKKNVDLKLLNEIPCNKKIIDILIKYDKVDSLSKLKESVLLEKIEGDKTVLQYLIENYDIKRLETTISEKETLKLLHDLGKLNDIKIKVSPFSFSGLDLNEKSDFSTEEESILEYLVRNKVHFKLQMWDTELCQKIFKMNYLESFPEFINLEDLIENDFLEKYIEEVKKENIENGLNNINLYSSTTENKAIFYITLAKKDMLMYAENLEIKDLLEIKNNTFLLKELIKLDKDLTLNKIIEKEKYDPRIAIVLNSMGIDLDYYNVGKVKNATSEYRDSYVTTNMMGPLLNEGEELLMELEELFKNDGKSSSDVIDVLLQGYRNMLIQYYDMAVCELRNLIEIKKNNPDFIYVRDDIEGYFRPSNKEIHSSLNLETVMHETGHALHEFLMESSTPDEYEELKKKLREDPNTMSRLIEFREEVSTYIDFVEWSVEGIIEEKGIPETEGIEEYLASDMEEKKEKLKDVLEYINIDEESLNKILSNMYTKEQYEEYKKKIISKELRDSIIRNDYPVYTAISDIFDSIYQGKFRAGILATEYGDKIKGWYGHGIPYYSKPNHGFDELVAEFSSLTKLPNPEENLNILKKYIGDEMYNMISEYYYNNIIIKNYKDLQEETSFTL